MGTQARDLAEEDTVKISLRMSIQNTTQKTPIVDKGLDAQTIKKLPGPPEFTEELRMRQETDGVLLESFLIYEPEHQATWFKWVATLTILSPLKSDGGDYKCSVKNKWGTDYTTF